MQKITFKTPDNVDIVGQYYAPVHDSTKGILCLHMMPLTKESWDELACLLSGTGWHVLAIDERGHGESTQQGSQHLDYTTFTDQQQQDKRLDVNSSLAWLQRKGVHLSECTVIGASIGANLALDALVRFPELKSAVLLSPGLDYRGIKTDKLADKLSAHQKVLLLASQDDDYSFQTIQQLDTLMHIPHEVWKFSNLGHGNTMTITDPNLNKRIHLWVEQNLKA